VSRRRIARHGLLAAWLVLAVAPSIPAAQAAFRPFLVGLLVDDLAASRKWYEEVLQLRVDAELPASGDLSGVILERDGFRLELIARKGSFAASSRVAKDDEPLLRGIKKIAFAVDDLTGPLARASARGTTVVRDIHASRYDGMRSVILADPDGNWVQLYDRHAAGPRQ
jgi:catechol 2,3-dioxygenase-like lactoylglutathione lyase family enzyme